MVYSVIMIQMLCAKLVMKAKRFGFMAAAVVPCERQCVNGNIRHAMYLTLFVVIQVS